MSSEDMLKIRGLLALTEDQKVGWRLIKAEKKDNKNYETDIAKSGFTLQWNLLFYLFFHFE